MLSDPTAKSCLEALMECCKKLSSEVNARDSNRNYILRPDWPDTSEIRRVLSDDCADFR